MCWTEIEKLIMTILKEFFKGPTDPRVKEWFLISSPWYSLITTFIYVLIVKVVGPKYMENRKPYDLKNILLWYNAFQVAVSTFLFYESVIAGWLTDYSWIYQPIDYSTSPKALRTASLVFWFHMSRYTELCDTLFFVLRKKSNQVTFLHVTHHELMPYFSWVYVKAGAGGSTTVIIFLNSFIHIVMYTYYLLAGMGPQVQKYLWWKKHITELQLVQFVFICTHSISAAFATNSNIPRIVSIINISATVYFFVFFSIFYSTQYNNAHPKKTDEITKVENGIDYIYSKIMQL